jgi:hypothetical protein
MYASVEYRWFTPDPLQADIFNPQSMSRYSYAGGNGTNLTDPTGLFAYCPYGETDNQCNPPPDSQYYMNLSYYEWSCMLNNCMPYGGQPTVSGGGGQAPAPAPKPAPPTVSPPFKPAPPPAPPTTVIGPAPPPPVPTHSGSYTDYLTCIYNELIGDQIGNPDQAGLTILLNAAAFGAERLTPLFGAVATVYDVGLEASARSICSQEVYGRP